MKMQVTSPEELGKAIRSSRKKIGLTQKKLASLAGVGARFLSELERGKATAQVGKTLMIMSLLGLEMHINERR
jgi:y4mF family transcriptional regulator